MSIKRKCASCGHVLEMGERSVTTAYGLLCGDCADRRPQRNLSVTPDHNAREIGYCNACLRVSDSQGNPLKEMGPYVWEVRLNQAVVRLCDKCMDDLVEQYYHHKARRKAQGKKL